MLCLSRWGSAPSAMSLRTSARAPVRGRGRVVRRGARGGTSGWAIGSRVVPATAVPEELVNQVSLSSHTHSDPVCTAAIWCTK